MADQPRENKHALREYKRPASAPEWKQAKQEINSHVAELKGKLRAEKQKHRDKLTEYRDFTAQPGHDLAAANTQRNNLVALKKQIEQDSTTIGILEAEQERHEELQRRREGLRTLAEEQNTRLRAGAPSWTMGDAMKTAAIATVVGIPAAIGAFMLYKNIEAVGDILAKPLDASASTGDQIGGIALGLFLAVLACIAVALLYKGIKSLGAAMSSSPKNVAAVDDGIQQSGPQAYRGVRNV